MVLGLSLRKSKKSTADKQAPIRVSPSLPDIRAQSMAWPESLVDLPSYNQKGSEDLPPRTSTNSNAPIATIYAREHPPSSFSRTPAAVASPRRQSTSTRRPRMPMPFNLMVAGPRGVGKTALLRLLLQMSEASVPLDSLPARPTRALSTTTTELPGQDRLVLTAIDTPGLDYAPGAELELEKAVTGLVKYVDTQYAETLGEESKVVRQSKGDHHVHLCIYLIDPASIQTPAQRNQLRPSRSLSALRSDTPENSTEDWDSDSSDEEEDEPDMTESGPSRKLSMLPAEVRAIQRLSRRTNVLPIVARGDTLTDARLSRIKRVVRRDLANAGVDLRLFGIGEEEPQRGRVESRVERQDDEEERKVIKTRYRLPSRTRPSADQQNEGPTEPLEGVHVIPKIDEATLGKMFPFVVIAPDVHKAKAKRERKPASPEVTQAPVDISQSPSVPGTPMAITTDDPDLPSAEMTGTFPSAPSGPAGLASPAPNAPSRSPSTYASPGVLPPSSWRGANQNAAGSGSTRIYPRGQYTRKYRWGTIDVLDPAHCDVGVLRGVILGSHLKALKTHTREVLYERFRTEKLLARRATQNITPEQRSRLLKGLDP